jgi:hypothetical protein
MRGGGGGGGGGDKDHYADSRTLLPYNDITPIVEIIWILPYRGHILSLHFSIGGRIHEHHFGICEMSGQEKKTP